MLHHFLAALLLILFLIPLFSCSGKNSTDVEKENVQRPYNIVLILTDDQRWDSLWSMPNVQKELVEEGVTFTNAFVSTPVCCPSRAGLLSGGYYAHNTGVLENYFPNGSARKFQDSETIGTLLQEKGYQTALIGKYLNLYGEMNPPFIPPGWNMFSSDVYTYHGKRDWFNFVVREGSSGPTRTNAEEKNIHEYKTDYQKKKAIEFLNQQGEDPFFLLLSAAAPHSPSTPLAIDEKKFSDYQYRGRAYDETDLSDKPGWGRRRIKENEKLFWDKNIQEQLQSLQAVDRAVKSIVDKVRALGKFDQTIFIFTSDNGFLWGEHGLYGKSPPYEESIRVPLVIRMPGLEPRKDESLVVANLDIGRTILDLARTDKKTDGRSLVPLLKDPSTQWRKEFFFECFLNQPYGIWSGIRTKEWKYIEYINGEAELYNLIEDPYEEENRLDEPACQKIIKQLTDELNNQKGMAVDCIKGNRYYIKLPDGFIGQDYMFQLKVEGGKPPFHWRVAAGSLPQGLSLDDATGIISGVPVKSELLYSFIQTSDSSNPNGFNRPFSYLKRLTMETLPSPGKCLLALGDVNANNSPDLAVLKFTTINDAPQLLVVDSATGENINTINLPDAFQPIDIVTVFNDEIQNKAIAILGQDKLSGLSGVSIYDIVSGRLTNRLNFDRSITPFCLADTDVYTRKLAIGALNESSGEAVVSMIDSGDNEKSVKWISLGKDFTPRKLFFTGAPHNNEPGNLLLVDIKETLNRTDNLLLDTATRQITNRFSFEDMIDPADFALIGRQNNSPAFGLALFASGRGQVGTSGNRLTIKDIFNGDTLLDVTFLADDYPRAVNFINNYPEPGHNSVIILSQLNTEAADMFVFDLSTSKEISQINFGNELIMPGATQIIYPSDNMNSPGIAILVRNLINKPEEMVLIVLDPSGQNIVRHKL